MYSVNLLPVSTPFIKLCTNCTKLLHYKYWQYSLYDSRTNEGGGRSNLSLEHLLMSIGSVRERTGVKHIMLKVIGIYI